MRIINRIRYVFNCILGHIYRKRVRARVNSNQRIVFLVDYPQGWNSLKSIFYNLKKQNFDVILIAYIGWPYPGNNEAFWKCIDENVIIIKDSKQRINLKKLHANVVFKQTPYDSEYPIALSAKKISKVSKLCYIPYGYEPSPLKHLDIEYNNTFFPFVYAVFCDNTTSYEYCINKKNKTPFSRDILCYNYGYPRFDLDEISKSIKKYNTFLWLPRWSLDNEKNNGTSFFLFYDKLIEFFSLNKELNLIIRPHPSMFNNFILEGVMDEKKVFDIKKEINSLNNVFLDENPNYIESFNKSDILISDFSSLIIEYFISGKPIIYWGDSDEFNFETKKMIDLSYKVSNWDDLCIRINDLKNCLDFNYEKRLELVKAFLNKNNGLNATQNISEAIKDI